MDHAVDGYTVWGAPLLYKIQEDWSSTAIKKDTADDLTMTGAEMGGERPYATDTNAVGDFSGVNITAINSSQIRAWVPILKDTAEFNCVIVTSAEFYMESGFICFPGVMDTTITAGNVVDAAATNAEFTLESYG